MGGKVAVSEEFCFADPCREQYCAQLTVAPGLDSKTTEHMAKASCCQLLHRTCVLQKWRCNSMLAPVPGGCSW